jgi:cell division FtsZ-interacting protein ZapD
VEAAAFTEILAVSKKMSEEEIRLWLQNPPVFQGEKKADAVMAQIKLQAIRALASQSAGHKLSDKEWATLVIRRNHQSG